jgi:hypothetical protein
MPFYRINGSMVHVRGRNLPPPCIERVGFDTQAAEFDVCGGISAFQCDWDVGSGKSCDRHLCAAHTHEVGRNVHYCPDHHLAHINTRPQLGLFTSLVQP